MGFFDTILAPIMWAVAWIMVGFHEALGWIGVSGSISWVLSIVGLVVVIRILLIPLFFKQIKASRGMQMLQPDMQKLQKKYKGKTDPASRQAMQEEMMALYKRHGTNPFASCLPILAQSPIFFALFRVLYSLTDIASGERAAIGPITQDVARAIEGSELFGASLSSWFLQPDASMQVRIVTVILIVAMSVTTFTTQRQLTMKNMPAAALDNPMAKQQKMLMYILPLVFAFSGVNFPIGVLLYWLTTNLWSMGQQFYTIRKMPAPGSEAEKKFKERQARKNARKGIVPEVEQPEAVQETPRGQRVQPKRKDRARRPGQPGGPVVGAGALDDAAEPEALGDAPAAPASSGAGSRPAPTSPGASVAGLTPEERAARRHAERAERRRAERARQGGNQAKKKRK
ncbi:membrane protein insertase YidC [Georgenia faecalis]|uniref:membrane protein insertase YidC n=1 Tax=Georgenia faecalis TaxID=2483799 RepID=UPI000FDC128E|nr:membrane protein insertase YidC [Georgenia faecalis]